MVRGEGGNAKPMSGVPPPCTPRMALETLHLHRLPESHHDIVYSRTIETPSCSRSEESDALNHELSDE
jgi:hypothetical protein